MQYKYDVDHDVARIYAKKNCTTCYGRGLKDIQTGHYQLTIKNSEPVKSNSTYCHCVRNNMKKNSKKSSK
jgi:hypothetical protein